jgi:hypothetical protein
VGLSGFLPTHFHCIEQPDKPGNRFPIAVIWVVLHPIFKGADGDSNLCAAFKNNTIVRLVHDGSFLAASRRTVPSPLSGSSCQSIPPGYGFQFPGRSRPPGGSGRGLPITHMVFELAS